MKRTVTRTLILLSSLLISATFASQAHARAKRSADRSSVEEHYKNGMKAYTLGRFPEAIEEFKEAYELRSEPIFLYNIAQSHRQNKQFERAIFFYRRYLEAEPKAKNRADIEQRIDELQAEIDRKKAETPLAPPPQPIVVVPPPTPLPVAPLPVPPPTTVVHDRPVPPASSPGRGLRIAGIIVGAVGVAGVATGIVFGLHATSLHDEAVKSGSVYDNSKYQSAKTYKDLQWVALGVGGAAIVTGGVLYFLGATAKSSDQEVAILPLVGPGMGGAAFSGAF